MVVAVVVVAVQVAALKLFMSEDFRMSVMADVRRARKVWADYKARQSFERHTRHDIALITAHPEWLTPDEEDDARAA